MASDLQVRTEFDTAYPFLVTVAERAIRSFFRYDPSQVEEAVAETMAQTYADWERVRPVEKAIPRVTARAKKVCLERIHREALRVENAVTRPADAGGLVDLADATALSASIALSLDRLSRRQRDVAVVHYLMDCDEKTTAAALHTSVAGVRKAAREARSRSPLLFFEVLATANDAHA